MIRTFKEAITVLEERIDETNDPLREAVEWIIHCMRASWGNLQEAPKCSRCGLPCLENYMLLDEVWTQALPEGRGVLHLKCVEKSLGRSLQAGDFKNIPINYTILHILQGSPKGKDQAS
jgi:hypothetical protein